VPNSEPLNPSPDVSREVLGNHSKPPEGNEALDAAMDDVGPEVVRKRSSRAGESPATNAKIKALAINAKKVFPPRTPQEIIPGEIIPTSYKIGWLRVPAYTGSDGFVAFTKYREGILVCVVVSRISS